MVGIQNSKVKGASELEMLMPIKEWDSLSVDLKRSSSVLKWFKRSLFKEILNNQIHTQSFKTCNLNF